MKGDLTRGSPTAALLRFTLPILLSMAFQQVYSISDSIIVGKFSADGEAALAAVGASYPITMVYIAIAVGCNAGCSVVMSRLFGSRRFGDLKTCASTSVLSAVVLSLVLTAVGIFFEEDFLLLLNTPENILDDSVLYLKLFFIGFLLLFLYNIAMGIYTAVGDSVTPLVFLISSSVANIVLNYIFVKYLHLDVFGVALASVISQSTAGILSMVFMLVKLKGLKSGKYKLFSSKMLGSVASYAVPGILQQSFVSVGDLLIQGLVNTFGSSVIAGYSAAIKLNTFAVSSLATLGTGISGFTAQNIGAGKLRRVKRGMSGGAVMACIVGAIFTVSYFCFSDGLISVFMAESDMSDAALSAGREFLRIASPFYILAGAKLLCDGVLRGGGATAPFLGATVADLLFRVVLSYSLCALIPSLEYRGIWIAVPAGWIIALAISATFVLNGAWKRGNAV